MRVLLTMLPEVKDYIIFDIETCPLNLEGYDSLTEAEKGKLINPIDSRIVAIGVRHNGEDFVWCEDSEAVMLVSFWQFIEESLRATNYQAKLVGFNVKEFDLPFLITRSFVNNIEIVPLILNDTIIDLREKFTAYSYTSRARGKLKEYGEAVGIKDSGVSGKDIAGFCIAKQRQRIVDYLMNDLLVTDEVFKRARALKIIYVDKW